MMIPIPPATHSLLISPCGTTSFPPPLPKRRRRRKTLASLMKSFLSKWGCSLAIALISLFCCVTLSSAQVRSVFDGICPTPQCYCGLDPKHRREVACTTGSQDDIPASRMSPNIEVIRIVAPVERPNHLTIGRFFRQFRKLQELHIVGSNVPNIGENNFWGMTNLKLLNLSRNKIDNVVDSNFKGLSELESLDLSDNAISSFVSASFEHLGNLKYLDISRNRATKLVERLFYNLHKLEVLDLSDNKLRKIETDVFRDIWVLREFRCQRCGIQQLDNQLFPLLPKLKVMPQDKTKISHDKAKKKLVKNVF